MKLTRNLISQPLDFASTKPRTRAFLKDLFTEVFLGSQRSTPLASDTKDMTFTRNRNAIEAIFIKASRVQALAMGLVYFFSDMSREEVNPDDGLSKFLLWSAGVATETLRSGIDSVPSL